MRLPFLSRFRRGTVTWPPPRAMNDAEFLEFCDPRNLKFEDSKGNPITVRPVYPAFETSWTVEGGATARHIYEDRTVELVWDPDMGQWYEPEESA